MRARSIAALVVLVVAALGFAGWRLWATFQTAAQVPVATASPALAQSASSGAPEPAVTPSPLGATSASTAALPSSGEPASSATPASGESPVPGETPAAGGTPSSGGAQLPSASPTPTETPTIPAEPTGLPAGWELQAERTAGGREADLVVRTGDINNLGYGWPAGFTPFSGKSTPAHPWPCQPRPGAAPGTDRIMLGTGVTATDLKTRTGDGYAGCSKRPDNLPQAIGIVVGALPSNVHVVLVQMFLDDFQVPVWHSHFQLSLNGTRIPPFEDTINTLDQTGPIGKLVTLRLLPEYVPILRAGTVNVLIDDPTTHQLDGYAVDFVRILVNPHAFQYAVTIACAVVDADTQKPIAAATVSSAQVSASTGADGSATLSGVPAGLASVGATAVGYDSDVQLLDLPAGTRGEARFTLHRHREGVADLQRSIARNGSVAIYGIHFDTASAQLRADSLPSLETVLQLVKGTAGSHWIIAGHTDNQGGAAYNLDLSIARAKSVVTWLRAHGVAENRLVAQGYGLTRPVADNATVSGRALNRRVEVKLVK